MGETLKKLSQRFGIQRMSEEHVAAMPIARRRTTEYDETVSGSNLNALEAIIKEIE